MKLINQTPHQAQIFRGAVDEHQMFGTLVARIGFVVGSGGACEPTAPAEPVRPQDEERDGAILEGDAVPVKEGVDICLVGRAYPARAPATTATVSVRVGDTERSLRVTGDRVWEPRRGVDLRSVSARARKGDFDADAFRPTAPAPFESMPMSWSRAFGGKAEMDGQSIPHAENPEGRGFLVVPDNAAGVALPNLEDPGHLVAHWRDWPPPTCFAPVPRTSKLRTDRGLEVDAANRRFTVKPAYFSSAHPWLLLPKIDPDCPITVGGMTREGTLAFRLPDVRLRADIRIGARTLQAPLRLDTVEIAPDERRFSCVLRTAFRYYVNPGEHRNVTLTTVAGAGS